ncbi:MAG: PKD domain-containing protein [Bacteroidia bacterium]|nr:PKD domain-containing protein [Bacteroidia bacterium]
MNSLRKLTLFCSFILGLSITSFGQCTASFSFTQSTWQSVNFVNTSTGNMTGADWDFGNGTVASGSPGNIYDVNYANPGSYTVCLIIYGSNCADTVCQTVVVAPGTCHASFYTYADTTGQYGIIGVNTSFGANLSYLWDFGDGNTSTQAYPQHTYASAGTYGLCLTVSDSGCTDTYCDTITVTQKVGSTLTLNVINPLTGVPDPIEGPHLVAYPNPFGQSFKLELDLRQSGEVRAELFDLSGRSTGLIQQRSLLAGKSSLEFNAANLSPGVYFLRVESGKARQTVKLLKRN